MKIPEIFREKPPQTLRVNHQLTIENVFDGINDPVDGIFKIPMEGRFISEKKGLHQMNAIQKQHFECLTTELISFGNWLYATM